MKKLATMFVLTASLVGSMAFAQSGVVGYDDAGNSVMQPFNGYRCDEPMPQPTSAVPMHGYCDNGGTTCPPNYDRVAKWCWGGWGNGWHRCGYVCSPNGGNGN